LGVALGLGYGAWALREVSAGPATPPSAPFTLPWGGGERRFVLQGQDQGSHVGFYGKYAWDFARAPFDSTSFVVVAARAGIVKEVVQDYDDSPDCDISYNARTNYVLVDHGDGYGSVYLHLKKGSVPWRPGQQVDRGQPLASTGHTGFVCGTTHLHFTIVDVKTRESLDTPFVDQDTARDGGRPKTNEWYWAGTPPPPGATVTPTPTTTPAATATPAAGRYQRRFPYIAKRAEMTGREPGGGRAP
jgi:murein DD-endopeptidase MepM/ murein hydrolase activator NlpD